LFFHGTLGLESRSDNVILLGSETGIGVGLNLMTLLGQKLHQRGYADIQLCRCFFQSYSFIFFCHIALLFICWRNSSASFSVYYFL